MQLDQWAGMMKNNHNLSDSIAIKDASLAYLAPNIMYRLQNPDQDAIVLLLDNPACDQMPRLSWNSTKQDTALTTTRRW